MRPHVHVRPEPLAARHRVARALTRAALIGTASAALAAGPAGAQATPPTAPPVTWPSMVVNTDQLPISIPGVTRPPTTTATTVPGTTAVARPKAAPSGSREAPPATDPVWAKIRQCESGNRYALNTGNGYYGAYQFAAATWRRLGLGGLPHEAPPQVQDEAARLLYVRSGWGAWGACARRLGLT